MADHVENDRAVAPLFALAFVAMATPAGGILGCSFATMEQCQAAVSGASGCCERDPFMPNTSNAFAYQPKSPLAKSATHRARKPADNQ
jgi:hypothetical protein